MGNIVLLDELTINKIAAGEVIERPASVIKEMVENSIDAGATNITVEIKNGGISFIKVTDNGKGIAADDLEIAFERHATSKIRSADDLNTVTSMGFRGEALASIAAIANVEMISKTENQDIGYRVVVEAGDVLEKEEAGCRTGTTITVKNLFFNTPVRYKFLKKDYTESGYIEDVITRIALVNPNVAIKLINTGKTVIQTNGNGELKDVIYSIYGKDVANGILDVSYNYEDIKIEGVIGKPEIARSNRSNQLFFVNKRYIKDKTLTAATEQAYKGLIPIGKFGFVVLNIEMNPAKVDVNVHPAKLEVRFQEENKIFQSIYHAIKDTLLKGELVADTSKNVLESQNRIDRSALSFEERLKNLREAKKDNSNTQGGLFGFRKQNEKQIEEYTNEESKIKTNTNIVEDLYNKKEDENKIQDQVMDSQATTVFKLGADSNPVDTSEVLAQLKKMQNQIQNDLDETQKTRVINLSDINEEYKINNNGVENNVSEENNNEDEQKPQVINIEDIKEENKNYDKQDELPKAFQDMTKESKSSEDFNEMYTKTFGRAPISEEKQKIMN